MGKLGSLRKIELLAPARDYVTGRIAIDTGADAVYIGGPAFGARSAAGNSIEDIRQLVEYAHQFGAKVYAALNTLVFEDELADAEKTARELISAGVDALIIQDMSFLRMGLSGVELHASTQMCNSTPEQVEFLRECGFSRVILERGLTLHEIQKISEINSNDRTGEIETADNDSCGVSDDSPYHKPSEELGSIELECFVHGAICVGFSGRCYMSRSMNQRSGNRGDCSQPCRLTYDLIDGDGKTIQTGKHLLSVLDLNLSDRIPQLLDAGVTSFKIEGRLKDANYVRNVVSHYRQVIDKALKDRPLMVRSSSGRSECDFTPDPSRSFSRGFTTWMLDGKTSGQASFSTPKAIGEYIGRVRSVGRDSFVVSGNTPLHAGDGICFISGGELVGTNVNKADGQTIYPNKTDDITAGADVYRNYDHIFNMQLEKSRTRRVIGITVNARIEAGALTLTLTDEDGNTVTLNERFEGEPARDTAKMETTIRTQLSKFGDSIFIANTVDVTTQGPIPFIPVSQLNEMRRKATELLLAERLRNFNKPKTTPNNAAYTYITDGAVNTCPKTTLKDGAHTYHATNTENKAFPYPATSLGGEANVTNTLAEGFYRDHGVQHISAPLDLERTLSGHRVMTSAYCLRRELGQCLKERPTIQGQLRLKRGAITWLLEFDCAECRMNIIKE